MIVHGASENHQKWITACSRVTRYWISIGSVGFSRSATERRLPFIKIFCFYTNGTSDEEPACQCKRHGFDPWVGKIPWRGHGHPLQYSCLENPMDRGAWWATVHRVAKSQTWLKWLSTAQNSWRETLKYHRHSEMKVFHYQWRFHTVLTSLESSNMVQTDNTNDNTQEMYQILFCMPT